MRHHASFLIASVLIFVPGCERTRLAHLAGGTGGASALVGVTSTGGIAATGGAAANGGTRAGAGGVLGSGGTQSAGGSVGTGGSTSSATTDLDTCSSDADCTPCLWAPAPTDPSECPGFFSCCGGFSATKKRCEANHAAWNASCPGQTPQNLACPCILLCEGDAAISCVAGRCIFTCPTIVDAAPDDAFDSSAVPDADLRDAVRAD